MFDLPEQPDLGPWVTAISECGRITGRYLMRVVPSRGLPYFISKGVIATPKAALRVAER